MPFLTAWDLNGLAVLKGILSQKFGLLIAAEGPRP
jgi:hypothetical protein